MCSQKAIIAEKIAEKVENKKEDIVDKIKEKIEEKTSIHHEKTDEHHDGKKSEDHTSTSSDSDKKSETTSKESSSDSIKSSDSVDIQTITSDVDKKAAIQSLQSEEVQQQESHATSFYHVFTTILDLIGTLIMSIYNCIVQFFKLLMSFSAYIMSGN